MAEAKNESKKVKITMPRAKKGEPDTQFVSINGVNYLVPMGKTSEVPDYVAEEIKRAEAAAAYMDDERDRILSAGQTPKNM